MKKINSLDVVRNYYIANELLSSVFSIIKPTEAKIKKQLLKIIAQTEKIPDRFFLTHKLDNYHPRYDNYFNSNWELKTIPLKDCGVWARMGGLPDEATRGNIIDTAKFVKKFLEDKTMLSLETNRVLYIERIMEYAELISEHVPLIVMEGGVLRHNKLVKPEQRSLYKKCKYDIDDGNHRAVALAILGKKEVKAFVGKRISKSDLLYF